MWNGCLEVMNNLEVVQVILVQWLFVLLVGH
jgi:hypothetical protein